MFMSMVTKWSKCWEFFSVYPRIHWNLACSPFSWKKKKWKFEDTNDVFFWNKMQHYLVFHLISRVKANQKDEGQLGYMNRKERHIIRWQGKSKHAHQGRHMSRSRAWEACFQEGRGAGEVTVSAFFDRPSVDLWLKCRVIVPWMATES